MHKPAVHPLRILGVGILGFLGEGVGIEPRQQLQVQCQTHVPVLRRMYMQVVERRDKQFVPKINHLPPVGLGGLFGVNALNDTRATHRDIAVRDNLQFVGCRGVHNVCTIDFHDDIDLIGYQKRYVNPARTVAP